MHKIYIQKEPKELVIWTEKRYDREAIGKKNGIAHISTYSYRETQKKKRNNNIFYVWHEEYLHPIIWNDKITTEEM